MPGAPSAPSLPKIYNKNPLISQIITGVQNASRQESDLTGGVICLPTNGSRKNVYI